MPVGEHHDGGGLYCIIRTSNSASWHLRYTVKRRPDLGRRKMGLGSYPEVSLAAARDEADYHRSLAAQGIDPVEHRATLNRQAMTVREIFSELFEVKRHSLKGDGKAGRWMSPVENHIYPAIGDIPIARLTVQMIVEKLGEVYLEMPQTGDKVFARLKQALDYAAAQDERVDPKLVERAKVQLPRAKVIKKGRDEGHYPPLHWRDAPKLWGTLDHSEEDTALGFYLLTLPRVSNVIHLRWSQLDLDNAIWTIPPENLKTGVPFDAPLTDTALRLLRRARKFQLKDSGDLVFPSRKARKPGHLFHINFLTNRLKRDNWPSTIPDKLAVAHGCRATFSTWCAEPWTDDCEDPKFPSDLVETCIQHDVMSAQERAYQRSSLIRRRRKVMKKWEEYVISGIKARASILKRKNAPLLAGSGSPLSDPVEVTYGELETKLRAEPGDWDVEEEEN